MRDTRSSTTSPVPGFFKVKKPPRGFVSSFSVLFSIIVIMMVFSSTTLLGQNLAGTWQDSQYNIKMVLMTNGTYTLRYPNGYSQGRYNVNQGMFCLQDASGTSPVCYTVVSYTVNTLVLRDLNGMELNYRRQGGTAASPPAPAQPGTPANETGTGSILAQKGGYTLNAAHFNAGLGIVQLVIGQPVKAAEVQELKAKLIQEFLQAPAEAIRQLNSLAASLKTIRSASDPVRIGLTRQELFSAFYQATRDFKEEEKPLMIQVINRYIKVLAYDPANRLVLTDKDAEGMLQYLAFNSELMGQKIQLTPALRQAVITDLVNKFSLGSVEQKRLLCSASLIWQLVEANWNKMTLAQKQQYKTAYTSQIGQKTPAYQPANTNTTSTGYKPGSAKSTAEAMREYNARQQMFKMMSDMSLNNHALSLNIIENIGGTGNYWSVVDY